MTLTHTFFFLMLLFLGVSLYVVWTILQSHEQIEAFLREEQMDGMIWVRVQKGMLHILSDKPGWQNRVSSSRRMIERLYRDYGHLAPPDVEFILYTGDSALHAPEELQTFLTYSAHPERPGGIAVPDFTFDVWAEARIPPFEEVYHTLTTRPIVFQDKLPILFWRGQENAEHRDPILGPLIGAPGTDIVFTTRHPDQFVSIVDHAKYRYLLDIRGNGYSGRLKYLFLMGSTVFVMERGDQEYFWKDFVPWVHYVPVRGDASDLLQQLDRVHADQGLAERIARQGTELARRIFAIDHVYAEYARILHTLVPLR